MRIFLPVQLVGPAILLCVLATTEACWAEEAGGGLAPTAGELKHIKKEAEVAMGSGDWVGAVARWEQVLESEPASVSARNRLGIAHTRLGHYKAAEAEFREAIRIDEEDPSSYFNFALLYLHQGKTDLAEAWLNETLERASWYPEVHYHLGYIREKEGQYDEAVKEFVKELNVNPSCPKSWHELFRLKKQGYGTGGGLERPGERGWDTMGVVSLSTVIFFGVVLCVLGAWRS